MADIDQTSPAYTQVSPDTFMEWLLSALLIEGTKSLTVEDPSVDKRLRLAVNVIEHAALECRRSGETDLALQILDVLEDLRPDPNTGSMSGFWSAMRRQQPLRARFPNPRYKELEINTVPHIAERTTRDIPSPWDTLVRQAAEKIAHAS